MHWYFFWGIIHYSLKSDYSLFIYFFFYSLKIIGLFIIFRTSLFTIHYFLGSLFTIHYKKRPLFTNHYTPSRPSYNLLRMTVPFWLVCFLLKNVQQNFKGIMFVPIYIIGLSILTIFLNGSDFITVALGR